MDVATVMIPKPSKTHVTKRSILSAGSRSIGAFGVPVGDEPLGVLSDKIYLPECPAEPSWCVACTTRAAMAVSASLPQARGS